MFIAHAPSGYILAVSMLRRMRPAAVSAEAAIAATIAGALAPDLDLIYFFLVDHRHTHHHRYFSHWPLVWLGLLALAAIGFRRASKAGVLALLFCLGGVLHVILDSLVGDIWWLAPFVDRPYALATVPALRTPWWTNFLLHWSFGVELAICFWALLLHQKRQGESS